MGKNINHIRTGVKKFCAGAHVLVQKENKYLVLRRIKNDDDANCWDLPGGGTKFGEQPLSAAIREAKEEAGIKIKIIKPLSVWAMPYQKQWSVEINLLAKYQSGKIKLSAEHSNYRWVSKKELRAVKPKSVHLKSLSIMYDKLSKIIQ